jgi:hypothetical protein
MKKKYKHMHEKRFFKFLLSLVIIQIFFCAEYNNPFDPKVDKFYAFRVPELDSSSTLSIFQMYTLSMDESASNNKYLNFTCTVEKDNVAYIVPLKNDKFQIFFYKPCSTVIYINGVRPNEKNDEQKFKVTIENPYSITGKEIFAKNELVALSIIKTHGSVENGDPLINKVQWSIGSAFKELSPDSPFTLPWSPTLGDTIDISANLIHNNSTDTYRCSLGKKKIVFKGWAPRIDSVKIDFVPNDTFSNALNQADSFNMHLFVADTDLNPFVIVVKDSSNALLDSVKVDQFTDRYTLKLPGIKNFGDNTLRIKITDITGYQDSIFKEVHVQPVNPEVFIREMVEIAYDTSYVFDINSSVNSSSFRWVLKKDTITISDTITSEGRFQIDPLNKADTFFLDVQPFSTVIGQEGKWKRCLIITKEFTLRTVFKNQKDTMFVKINRPDTLYAGLTKDNTILTSSGIPYTWLLPSGTASQYITIKDPLKDSLAIFKFKEMAAPFKIEAKGTYGNEDVAAAQLIIKVTQFSPEFCITDTIYEQKVNIPVFPTYTIKLTDPKASPIAALYYKIPQQSNAIVPYDQQSGIKFKSTGNFSLIMWCVDMDGAVSKHDTSIVQISADLPFVKLKNDTVVVPINMQVSITGDTAFTGKAAIPIKSILLDFNNDGTYDTSVTVGANNAIVIERPAYQQPTLDSITIKCKDDSGNYSIPVKKWIQIFSDVPAINSCVRRDTSTIYKGSKVLFDISITDPDDSVLTLKIFGNDSLLKTISTGKQDTFSLQFNKADSYRIRLVAEDTKVHVSDTFPLTNTLIVDEGRPVISSIKRTGNGPVFIKDTVQFRVSAVDPNGSIREYHYYINDTLTVLETKTDSSSFKHVFPDSGKYVIFVEVIGDDSLFSAVKKDTVVVLRGEPVVKSITVDSLSCYINRRRFFTITASDTNGTLHKIEISWNDDTVTDTTGIYTGFLQNKSDTISHQFTTNESGNRVVNVRVEDDDGVKSAWKACSVFVKKGIPKITSIVPNQDVNHSFIKDSVNFTVTVNDSNANADSVYLTTNTTRIGVGVDSNNTCRVGYKFGKADTLLDSVRFIVIDKTKFSDSTKLRLHVSPGRPVVESVTVTTVSGNNLFVRDTNTFRIFVSDSNGTPKKIYAAWNNEITPTESLSITINSSGYGEFTHWYDTSMSGERMTKFWADDNDTLRSAAFNTNFLVRKGAPAVWGDNGDTVWVIINRGIGFYKIHQNAFDTNGTIQMHYWDDLQGWRDSSITDSSAEYQFRMTDINQGISFNIQARDNDQLKRGGQFVVFADSAPPEPLGLYVLSTDNGDSVQIQWDSTAFDKKDCLATEIKIMIRYSNSGEPDSVLLNWTAAYLLRTTGTKRYFKFKKSYTGDIRYRIHFRDLRKSESVSGIAPATIN